MDQAPTSDRPAGAGARATFPERLCALARPVAFARGAALYTPGHVPREIFLLREGFVKAGGYDVSGVEVAYDIIGPGEFCGNLRYLGGGRFREFARALTAVRADGLDVHAFKAIFREEPPVHDWFVRLIVSRWARAEERLFRTSALSPAQRLAALLADLAGQGLDARATLSQTDLAQLTGVTRQTVSRALRETQGRAR